LFGGYRLNDNFAVEAQVARLGESRIRYSGAAGALGTETYKATALSLAAVGLLPLGSDFTLFAKLGPSYTSAESSFNTAALGNNSKSRRAGLLAGVGASYRLTDNLSLRGELENYSRVGETAKAGRSTVNLLSASLAYRF
jgi:OmpA-OmpF porin, OOP family